ncbi:hypothetical protein FCM35_KLT06301 [Carex littledalei]|uniref:KIB1-4 beta-propeller domain-containing protein n=1 Tax=Carex littledalei TaxID=544730 RepID=A0A833QW12_9POAL|nr:hypothetical protein FCM35_KLT06301 [Carex littledalei]
MLPPQLRTRRISDPYVIFYDIAQSKTYRLWLPYMRGKYCRGSSHGWLVLEYLPRVSLLNPITKRCIDLPSLDSPPTLLRDATSKRMRSVPSNQHKEFCIKKASLSCTPSKPGCVVVALFCLLSSNWHLGFCRIGDSQWTKLKQDAGLVVRDFAFYNNLVYTVNTQMGISVYDLQGCPLWTFPSKINFYYNYFPTQIKLVEGDADSSGPLIVGTLRLSGVIICRYGVE